MIISPNQILAAEESRLLASTREPVTSSTASERLRETAGDPPAAWHETTSYHTDEAGQVGLLITLLDWLGELCDRIGRYRVFCGAAPASAEPLFWRRINTTFTIALIILGVTAGLLWVVGQLVGGRVR